MTREVGKSCFSCFGVINMLPGTVVPQANIPGRETCQNGGQRGKHSFSTRIERGEILYTSDPTAYFESIQLIVLQRSSTSYSLYKKKKREKKKKKKKKERRPRNRIHLPRGLLIVFHSTINPSNPLESTASRISSLFSSLQLLHISHLPGDTSNTPAPLLRVSALLCRNAASHGTLH
ncbi:hypothetical protein VN97_g12238 [Penicillium thymicola]|uniref:Uncharacterized protein n=1 Tax=Penicillium thymicola TaxID=293382 RepID=A0AAI9X2S2_PENTH|nr:hypothetical protein VN97_g12238 [Penicillium thymicola]